MNVQNIVLENMILQAKQGLDMTEGNNITLNNIQLITKEKNPVMNIHNSRNIKLSRIGYATAEVLLHVTGENTADISLKNTDAKNAKQLVERSYGAKEGVVKVEN